MAAEQFHYQIPDGREIVVPRFKNIPVKLIRSLRRNTPADQVFTVIEELAPDALPLIDAMDQGEFAAFNTAWQNDSNITPGESKASSGS